MGQAHRFAGPGKPFEGLTTIRNGKVDWSGVARFIPEALAEPLSWRKPARIFVNSMSDLFHHSITDAEIMRVWLTMARAPHHTFQILTKRSDRMRRWVERWSDVELFDADPVMARGPDAVRAAHSSGRALMFASVLDGMGAPPAGAAYPTYDWAEGPRWLPAVLQNVHLGVSCEDQERADDRITDLLRTPAAVRWISAEPLLGPLDLFAFLKGDLRDRSLAILEQNESHVTPGLDWIVVGGESGRGARMFDIVWAESIVSQCRDAGVPVFMKQLGALAVADVELSPYPDGSKRVGRGPLRLKDRKGGDIEEFPSNLQVREFPR